MDLIVEMEKWEETRFLGLSLTYSKHYNSTDSYFVQKVGVHLVLDNLYFDGAGSTFLEVGKCVLKMQMVTAIEGFRLSKIHLIDCF